MKQLTETEKAWIELMQQKYSMPPSVAMAYINNPVLKNEEKKDI